MNIVFLDFDGVVNTIQYMENARSKKKVGFAYPSDGFVNNRTAIEFVNMLCDKIDANIVVSSTWWIYLTVEELRTLLSNSGCKTYVLDKTPKLKHPKTRGDEIQQWLDDNKDIVSDFIILDDDSDMAHLSHKLVLVDNTLGFHCDTYRDALAMFNMKPWE